MLFVSFFLLQENGLQKRLADFEKRPPFLYVFDLHEIYIESPRIFSNIRPHLMFSSGLLEPKNVTYRWELSYSPRFCMVSLEKSFRTLPMLIYMKKELNAHQLAFLHELMLNKERFRRFFTISHKRPSTALSRKSCASTQANYFSESPPALDDGFNYDIEDTDESDEDSFYQSFIIDN